MGLFVQTLGLVQGSVRKLILDIQLSARGSTEPVDNLMVELWIILLTQRSFKIRTDLLQTGTLRFSQQYQMISITIRNLEGMVLSNLRAGEVINTC